MSFTRDVFRGPETSSLPLLTTKKGGPGLKMLRIGNSGLGINIPIENLMISGWLTKRQGGGSIFFGFLSMEVVLLAMMHRQMTSLAMRYLQTAEKITKSHLIGLEGFWSDLREFSEIWTLYAKNIMSVCSLPTSTSTWHSNHRNGSGGYMSGELKSENINKKKAPTRKSHHPEKITQPSH
jgi:hypothetical protein